VESSIAITIARAPAPATRPHAANRRAQGRLAPLVRTHAPELSTIAVWGTIVAARIIAEVANITRFKSDAQLALYAGVDD
jgi:transposase